MLPEELRKSFKPLRNELNEMNMSWYFLTQKSKLINDSFREGRELMLFSFVALGYLENGLVLHLTSLDDEKNSDFSFHSARKELEKINCDAVKLKDLKKSIADFRKEANFLKTKHRNIRIAHINHKSLVDIKELDDFMEIDVLQNLVSKANDIGDLLFGEEIRPLFKMGGITNEGHLDFRAGKRIYGPIE